MKKIKILLLVLLLLNIKLDNKCGHIAGIFKFIASTGIVKWMLKKRSALTYVPMSIIAGSYINKYNYDDYYKTFIKGINEGAYNDEIKLKKNENSVSISIKINENTLPIFHPLYYGYSKGEFLIIIEYLFRMHNLCPGNNFYYNINNCLKNFVKNIKDYTKKYKDENKDFIDESYYEKFKSFFNFFDLLNNESSNDTFKLGIHRMDYDFNFYNYKFDPSNININIDENNNLLITFNKNENDDKNINISDLKKQNFIEKKVSDLLRKNNFIINYNNQFKEEEKNLN